MGGWVTEHVVGKMARLDTIIGSWTFEYGNDISFNCTSIFASAWAFRKFRQT